MGWAGVAWTRVDTEWGDSNSLGVVNLKNKVSGEKDTRSRL